MIAFGIPAVGLLCAAVLFDRVRLPCLLFAGLSGACLLYYGKSGQNLKHQKGSIK